MNKIQSYLRNFADISAAFFGQVDSDSYKNSASLWSVIGMAVVGVVAIGLVAVTIYAILMS